MTTRRTRGRPKKTTTLEEEAKEFMESKGKPKDISERTFLAGMALAGLLSRSSYPHKEEIKKEAYSWADFMLNDEN